MKMLFATHNQGKYREVASMVPSSIQLISYEELSFHKDVEETGDTLEANALIKARFAYNRFGINCLAEDTGLEVKALNGQPGVNTARFAGKTASSAENMSKLLQLLEGKKIREARFVTYMVLIVNGRELIFRGICKGDIGLNPIGELGFGYDPIFVPKGYERTFAQMSDDEKSTLSHGAKALEQVLTYLEGIAQKNPAPFSSVPGHIILLFRFYEPASSFFTTPLMVNLEVAGLVLAVMVTNF